MFLTYKYGITNLEDILVSKKGMVQNYAVLYFEGREKNNKAKFLYIQNTNLEYALKKSILMVSRRFG